MTVVVPATWTVSEERGPTANLTASVLLAFSIRELAVQKTFMQLLYTCVAFVKLLGAWVSLECAEEPTFKLCMYRLWPEAPKCFNRESMTMMNNVGNKTIPAYLHGVLKSNWNRNGQA